MLDLPTSQIINERGFTLLAALAFGPLPLLTLYTWEIKLPSFLASSLMNAINWCIFKGGGVFILKLQENLFLWQSVSREVAQSGAGWSLCGWLCSSISHRFVLVALVPREMLTGNVGKWEVWHFPYVKHKWKVLDDSLSLPHLLHQPLLLWATSVPARTVDVSALIPRSQP